MENINEEEKEVAVLRAQGESNKILGKRAAGSSQLLDDALEKDVGPDDSESVSDRTDQVAMLKRMRGQSAGSQKLSFRNLN